MHREKQEVPVASTNPGDAVAGAAPLRRLLPRRPRRLLLPRLPRLHLHQPTMVYLWNDINQMNNFGHGSVVLVKVLECWVKLF